MNTRQWIRLSGQYYAYISHDEQNDWMTFIRGTPEVLEEVLTDKLIYRLEADWARLLGHGDDARTMLEELLVRDQKASAALAAKARQWVEEELPKLREPQEVEEKTSYNREQEIAAKRFNEWFPVGTVVEHREHFSEDWMTTIVDAPADLDKGSGEAIVQIGRCDDEVSIRNIRCPQPENVEAKHGVRGTEYEFKSARELVETWNKEHPVGTLVKYLPRPNVESVETKTRTTAYVASGLPKIYVEGSDESVRLCDCVAI